MAISEHPPAGEELQTEFPPRFRQLKRLGAGYVMLIALTGTAYWLWGVYSVRALQGQIDAIHARGEPAVLADFVPTGFLSDADNAAIPLQRAGAIADAGTNTWEAGNRLWEDAWALEQATMQERAAFAEYVTDRSEALRLVRSTRSMTTADWGTRMRKNWIQARLGHLNDQRDLARFLVRAAAHQHAAGDDAEALEICRDLLHQARLLGQDTPASVTVACARGLVAEALSALSQLAPTLSLPRDQVRPVIEELLDDRDARQRFIASMQFERAAAVDTFVTHLEGRRIWPLAMWRLDTARRMRMFEGVIAAGRDASYADAVSAWAIFQPLERPARRERDYFQQFSSDYPPRLERVARMLSTELQWPAASWFGGEANIRLGRAVVAIRLAARLYQLDHGKLPTQPSDLSVYYLPHWPKDPYARGGTALQLLTVSPRVVVICSVGHNGVFDRGADILYDALAYQRSWGGSDRRRLDLCCLLQPIDTPITGLNSSR